MYVSYSDVFGIDHGRGHDEDIRPGDLVRTSANLFPHFRVIAVAADKVWLRNAQNGADAIARIDHCRRINGEPGP